MGIEIHLSPEERSKVAAISRVRGFPKRSLLFMAGDPASSVFLLESGKVRISRLGTNGKQLHLYDLGPGELIGEMALIDQDLREADARVLEDAIVHIVDVGALTRLLEREPPLLLKFMWIMLDRKRVVEEKLEDLSEEAKVRIARFLLREVDGKETSDPQERWGSLIITHQELADFIGVTRERVCGVVKELERRGIIQKLGRRIVIADLGRLREIAQGADPEAVLCRKAAKASRTWPTAQRWSRPFSSEELGIPAILI